MPSFPTSRRFWRGYRNRRNAMRRPRQRRQFPLRRNPALVGGYNRKRNFYYTAVLAYSSMTELDPSISLQQLEDFYGGGLQFQLQQFPGYTRLQQLFDYYRIKSVTITFRPMKLNGFQFNMNTALTNDPPELIDPTESKPYMARLYTVIDKNDISAPSNLSGMLSDSSLFVTNDRRDHRRTFKPRAIMAASIGGTDALVAQSSPTQWFNTSSADVKYYGLKYGITGHEIPDNTTGPIIGQVWSLDVKAVIEFKDPK